MKSKKTWGSRGSYDAVIMGASHSARGIQIKEEGWGEGEGSVVGFGVNSTQTFSDYIQACPIKTK